MKTISIKNVISPLLIMGLCLVLLSSNNVMAQTIPEKNVKTIKVERATEVKNGNQSLKLSEEQKAKMKNLRLEHMKAIRLLKAESEELAAHLKTLNIEGGDTKATFKTIDEMMVKRGEIMKRSISFRQAVKAILTPEQLKALEARAMNKHSEMGRRGQQWGRQGNHNFGRGQMMQRGGMGRQGMMMQHRQMGMRGQMGQGGQMGMRSQMGQNNMGPQGMMMMKRQGGQMGNDVQVQKRFRIIKDGKPVVDTVTVK